MRSSPSSHERWPLEVELPIVMHEGLVRDSGGTVEQARARIRKAAEEHERKARDERRTQGLGFMGRARAMRVAFTTTSTSREEWGRRNPTFAAAGDQDAATAALARRRNFDANYTAALLRWRAGDRGVVFPCGTWQLARHHGARVAPGPAG